MSDLPRPDFIDRDPQQVEAEAIALYEAIADKKLYPAQPERLLLDVLHYRESLVRLAIQDAAEQNLVNYARGVNLDQLGALLGVTRLQPSKARCTLQFSKDPGAVGTSLVVPAGTRASDFEGNILFATEENLTIPPGDAAGLVFADALLSGAQANGLGLGALTDLVDPTPGIATVTNTTVTNGGADLEADERLRTRIKLAPNLFSVAGSTGAYLYWVLTADQTIIDAAIVNEVPPFLMRVNVYPLTSDGPATSEILDKVADVLTDEKIRPLTDDVQVIAPSTVNYTLQANITLYSTADAAILQDQLDAAAQRFADLKRLKLGQDIVRSQAIAALSLPGVYGVSLVQPATDLVIAASAWANCTGITITLVGTNDG